MSVEEEAQSKLEKAHELKSLGNELFKAGKFNKARVKYATALAYTRGLPGREMKGGESMAQLAAQSQGGVKLSVELSEQLDDLDAIVKTNISTCFLKANKPSDALQAAREALEIKPSHWKAKLRVAEAKEKLRDFDSCLAALDDVSNHAEAAADSGAMTLVRKLRDLANKGIKEEASRQRKAFSNIFERARVEDSSLRIPSDTTK